VQHGAVVTLGRLLRQVADARPARAHAGAGFGRGLAEDQTDERGLAGAVRAHQRAAVARADDPVDAVEQHALADGVAHVLELDHRPPPPVGTPERPGWAGNDVDPGPGFTE